MWMVAVYVYFHVYYGMLCVLVIHTFYLQVPCHTIMHQKQLPQKSELSRCVVARTSSIPVDKQAVYNY